MKKILWLAAAAGILVTAGLAGGCAHKHEFGEWETVKAATCLEDGLRRHTCAEDNYSEEEVIPAPGRHEYGTNNVCVRCGLTIHPSEGLSYDSVDDGGEGLRWSVSIGTCSATTVVVPAYYANFPVVAVEEEGFFNPDNVETNGGKIERLWLPDGILSIGERAFYGCKALREVTLPNTLTEIGKSAFARCTALTTVNAPKELISIGDHAFSGCTALVAPPLGEKLETVGQFAFYGCTALTSANFGGSMRLLGENAFRGCTALRYATLGGKMETVPASAFSDCSSLVEVVVPASVTSFGSTAFGSCAALKTFRYGGDMAGWKAITRAPDWFAGRFEEDDLPTFRVYCTDGVLNQYDLETYVPEGNG